MESEVAPIFNAAHLGIMIFIMILGFVLIQIGLTLSDSGKRKLAWGISFYLVMEELLDRGFHVLLLHEPLKNNLPLHLCGMSVFLVAYLLVRPSQRLFELTYYWGLAGASMSILTPDVKFMFPHVLYLTFFISHGLIIIGNMYVLFVFAYRPGRDSLKWVFIATNIAALVIFPINLWLNTNYLFLLEKPAGVNLMDMMGPWPWYLLSLELAAMIFFGVLYLPFINKNEVVNQSKGNSKIVG